jgi:hypothetical protein
LSGIDFDPHLYYSFFEFKTRKVRVAVAKTVTPIRGSVCQVQFPLEWFSSNAFRVRKIGSIWERREQLITTPNRPTEDSKGWPSTSSKPSRGEGEDQFL